MIKTKQKTCINCWYLQKRYMERHTFMKGGSSFSVNAKNLMGQKIPHSTLSFASTKNNNYSAFEQHLREFGNQMLIKLVIYLFFHQLRITRCKITKKNMRLLYRIDFFSYFCTRNVQRETLYVSQIAILDNYALKFSKIRREKDN